MLFSEIVEKFIQIHLPTVSVGTQMRYQIDLKHRIKPYFYERELLQIDRLTIESFRSQIMPKLDPKSVNNCTQLLFLIFNKAVEWEMIEKNPMKLRKLRIPETKYHWWDEEKDISKFLAEAKRTKYYAAYLLALECGLRLGEIVGLAKQDVDLKRCCINIHQQWLADQKRLGPTKSGKQRFVAFHPKSDLKRALAAAISNSPDPHAIFVTRLGRRVHPTKIRTHMFFQLLRKSGVPQIRFHDLRHTFASWYMIKNDDIWSLKEILGHRDVQTTQRYAHLSSRHLSRGIIWRSGLRH